MRVHSTLCITSIYYTKGEKCFVEFEFPLELSSQEYRSQLKAAIVLLHSSKLSLRTRTSSRRKRRMFRRHRRDCHHLMASATTTMTTRRMPLPKVLYGAVRCGIEIAEPTCMLKQSNTFRRDKTLPACKSPLLVSIMATLRLKKGQRRRNSNGMYAGT